MKLKIDWETTEEQTADTLNSKIADAFQAEEIIPAKLFKIKHTGKYVVRADQEGLIRFQDRGCVIMCAVDEATNFDSIQEAEEVLYKNGYFIHTTN